MGKDNLPAKIAEVASPGALDFFQKAMPAPTPKLNPKSGFIGDALTNWKLSRMEKALEHESKIAEYQNKALQAQMDSIKRVVCFSEEVQTALSEYRTAREIRQEELKGMRLQNSLLEYEVANADIEFATRKREMEE